LPPEFGELAAAKLTREDWAKIGERAADMANRRTIACARVRVATARITEPIICLRLFVVASRTISVVSGEYYGAADR
jgi:hypothetical protein